MPFRRGRIACRMCGKGGKKALQTELLFFRTISSDITCYPGVRLIPKWKEAILGLSSFRTHCQPPASRPPKSAFRHRTLPLPGERGMLPGFPAHMSYPYSGRGVPSSLDKRARPHQSKCRNRLGLWRRNRVAAPRYQDLTRPTKSVPRFSVKKSLIMGQMLRGGGFLDGSVSRKEAAR